LDTNHVPYTLAFSFYRQIIMNPYAYSTIVFIAHWVIVVGMSIRIILIRPPVGVALAWLAVIYVVPFFGVGVYLLFGEKRLGPWRAETMDDNRINIQLWQTGIRAAGPYDVNALPSSAVALTKYIHNVLGFPVQAGNTTTLLAGHDAFFESLLLDIANAKHSINLQFYIWQNAGRCEEVINALIAASARDVKCTILVDAFGSKQFLRSAQARTMREQGIEIIAALPTGGLRTLVARTDLRNHRKIIVIDDAIAYSGSQNMVDPHMFRQSSGVGEWVDAMARIEGPTAASLLGVFQLDYSIESNQELKMPAIDDVMGRVNGKSIIQVVPSGPDLHPEAIHQIHLLAIYSAQRNLIMTTPYFVPDDAIVTALTSAALRGVEVTLIVPLHIDSIMVRFASEAQYETLMTAGVKIARFRDGLLHTKSLTIDDDFSLIGSVNLDVRSLWLNFEISLLLYDDEFTAELRKLQDSYLARADVLDAQIWEQRSLPQKFIEDCFRLVSPLL